MPYWAWCILYPSHFLWNDHARNDVDSDLLQRNSVIIPWAVHKNILCHLANLVAKEIPDMLCSVKYSIHWTISQKSVKTLVGLVYRFWWIKDHPIHGFPQHPCTNLQFLLQIVKPSFPTCHTYMYRHASIPFDITIEWKFSLLFSHCWFMVITLEAAYFGMAFMYTRPGTY